jgi:beta-glucosidase
MPEILFPQDFLWGASTSAHQIEGDNTNSDWWQWEQRGKSAEPSGRAADSWNHWRDDLDAASGIGLNVYRMSLEWAKIEPSRGMFSEEALAHYAEVLTDARRRGLQTMVVLWHFTNPLWFAEERDWMWREAPTRFEEYARVVARRLGHLIDHWVTLNEVNTFVWRGYIVGSWPPGRKDAWLAGYIAYRNLASAHRRARSAIKEECGEERAVGVAHLLVWPHPAERGGRFSAGMVAWWQFLSNHLFLDMVAPHADWLGVQYYHDSPARFLSIDNHDGHTPKTDMGWRIVPEGLYHVIMHVWRRYGRPIIVTENGLADSEDAQRGRFIIDHLSWVHRAIEQGADVRGYLHWSLIDNFEWSHGFAPRFGLVAVDYETFERSVRPSARIYGEIISANAIPHGLGEGLTYADGTPSLAPDAVATAGSRLQARPLHETGGGS